MLPALVISQRGPRNLLAVDQDCSRTVSHCNFFLLGVTDDAGISNVEKCLWSRSSVSAGGDGGDVVEALAWCPSGVVRLRAESIGECPPILVE